MHIKISSYFLCFLVVFYLATVQAHNGYGRQGRRPVGNNARIRSVYGQEALRQQQQQQQQLSAFTTSAPYEEQISKPHLNLAEKNNKYNDPSDGDEQETENMHELENVEENKQNINAEGRQDNKKLALEKTSRTNNKQTSSATDDENANENDMDTKMNMNPSLNSTLDTNNVDKKVNNVNGIQKMPNNKKKNTNNTRVNNKNNKNGNSANKKQKQTGANQPNSPNSTNQNKPNRIFLNGINNTQPLAQRQRLRRLLRQLLQQFRLQGR